MKIQDTQDILIGLAIFILLMTFLIGMGHIFNNSIEQTKMSDCAKSGMTYFYISDVTEYSFCGDISQVQELIKNIQEKE